MCNFGFCSVCGIVDSITTLHIGFTGAPLSLNANTAWSSVC